MTHYNWEDKFKLDRVDYSELYGYSNKVKHEITFDWVPDGSGKSSNLEINGLNLSAIDYYLYEIYPNMQRNPSGDDYLNVIKVKVIEAYLTDGWGPNYYSIIQHEVVDRFVSTELILGEHLYGTQYVLGTKDRDVVIAEGDAPVVFNPGGGRDEFHGGSGDDWIFGDFDGDRYYGGDGSDTLDYSQKSVSVVDLSIGIVWADKDNLGELIYSAIWPTKFTSIENYVGSSSNESILGSRDSNKFIPGGGFDYVNGRGGTDSVDYSYENAGQTVHLITSNEDANDLRHTADVTLNVEVFYGSKYDDQFLVYDDYRADYISGNTGFDTLNFLNFNFSVYIDVADDGSGEVSWLDYENKAVSHNPSMKFESIEGFTGTAFADEIYGSSYDDTFYGSGGGDRIDGGRGFDTVTYENATEGVKLSLKNGGSRGEAEGDTYYGIEKVIGSSYDDTLQGTSHDDILDGGRGGGDIIKGWGGKDTIYVTTNTENSAYGDEAKVSQLWGGSEKDTFVFSRVGSAIDVIIKDFELGLDKIDISDHGFNSKSEFGEKADVYLHEGGTLVYLYERGLYEVTKIQIENVHVTVDDFIL